MEIILKDKNGVVLHTEKKYCKEDITVNLETEEVNIIPTTEEQTKEGLINKVTVPGEANLLPENIKKRSKYFWN